MSGRDGSSGDLTAPFIFVSTGDPEPTAWMAAHPDWIKIPATLVPRGSASSGSTVPHGTDSVAVAGTAAAVAPGIAEGAGAGFIGGVGELSATAAAPLAALGILLYPSRTAPPDLDELLPGGEGFDPHPAMPPLPGLIPPATQGREKAALRRSRPRRRSRVSTPHRHHQTCCLDGQQRNKGRPSFSRTATTGLLVGRGQIPSGHARRRGPPIRR